MARPSSMAFCRSVRWQGVAGWLLVALRNFRFDRDKTFKAIVYTMEQGVSLLLTRTPPPNLPKTCFLLARFPFANHLHSMQMGILVHVHQNEMESLRPVGTRLPLGSSSQPRRHPCPPERSATRKYGRVHSRGKG